ncbi:MAG: hypothetical protein KKB34_08650 [Bacteroidetes bacterium]|nr:hypothetical protein [Bacteroidota bacterium]
MKKIGLLLFGIIVILIVLFALKSSEKIHPPGIIVNEIPQQNKLSQRKTWIRNGFFYKALAEFSLTARVLGKKEYSTGTESKISQYDLALGWGQMSDSKILDDIEVSQEFRFYFWKTDKFPIPREDIEKKSANMHIIAANENIEEVLDEIVVGDIIQYSGYLVEVRGPENFNWKSSLTRSDTGNGACEIVWVENIVILF